MAGFIYNLLSYIQGLGVYGIFAVSLTAVCAAFAVAFCCAAFVKGRSIKRRAWYFVAVIGICGIQLGLSLIFGYGVGFCIITLSLGVLLSIPVFLLKKREKTSEKQRELARFIDGQIKKANEKDREPLDFNTRENSLEYAKAESNENFSAGSYPETNDLRADANDIPKTTAVNMKDKKNSKRSCDIDFTHVKNVIARLEYLSLGPTDRKQIKDLESCVYMAENGDYTPQLKGRINDGLGSLLKIMAKYGV